MRARMGVSLLLLLLAAAPGRASAKPRLLVLPASGSNVSPPIIERARRYLVERLDRSGDWLVVDMDRPARPSPLTPDEVAAAASSVNADATIQLHIRRSPASTEVWLRTGNAGGPSEDFSEPVAGGPAELPAAIDRLVERTDRSTRRRSVERSTRSPWTVGLRGQGLLPIENEARGGSVLGFGGFLARDVETLFAEVGGSVGVSDAGNFWSIGAGCYYLLGDRARDVYAGVGLRWGSAAVEARKTGGLVLIPAIGLRDHRAWLRVRLEVGYWLQTYGERWPDRLMPGFDAQHYKHGPMVTLGVGL